MYQYKDHLGSIRLSYDKTLAIQEENNYYPFGLKHSSYGVPIVVSTNDALKYKYNGKELQDELGLNTYDYGARFYDPATGRWYSVDAMAEKYSEMSPYNYALNNPVIYVDPDGNEVEMCCDGLKGFLVGLADNVAGTSLRSNYGGSDFNNGARLADVVSVIGGSMLTGKGLADMASGAAGLSASASATVATGGLAGEVTAPVAGVSGLVGAVGALEILAGKTITSNAMSNLKEGSNDSGSRRKNRIPDEGKPNSMETNKAGTTTKKYGPDGKVQKEYNKGHQGPNTPKSERSDHVHDYKPNPNNPSGRGDRQTGRAPKPNEMSKDRAKIKNATNGS